MGNLKLYKTLLCLVLIVLVVYKVILIVPKAWYLMIMGFSRLWMCVALNFIVISILISSSSFTHKLNNFILKIHKSSSHNISSLISQTSQKFPLPFDDDTWWSRVVHHDETRSSSSSSSSSSFIALNESHIAKDYKTVWFQHAGEMVSQEMNPHQDDRDDQNVAELEEEVETMDATWKAIMEAKNKAGGPHLKKSGTWTAGDREVTKAKAGKGRLGKNKVELKKCKTFGRRFLEEKKELNGEAKVELTYHDEFKNRADAFIARVTNDMRLQRLDSHHRFHNTINSALQTPSSSVTI